MIFAKCIRKSQIAYSKEEFIKRSTEEQQYVYCENETTTSKLDSNDLYCVPLNYIYDCLKYGQYIAIIDIENNNTYTDSGSYLNKQITMPAQKVLKILDAYSKECIDYLFNEIDNPELIHSGYLHWLPIDLQEYFYSKQNKQV